MDKLPEIKLHFDAACRNVPNENCPMGIGVAVFIDEFYREDLSIDVEYDNFHLDGTNNVGEWLGLIECIKHIDENFADLYPENHLFHIYGDSQLIVNQFNGKFAVKNEDLKKLCIKARTMSAHLNILLNWLPRALNKEADILSKRALNKIKNSK